MKEVKAMFVKWEVKINFFFLSEAQALFILWISLQKACLTWNQLCFWKDTKMQTTGRSNGWSSFGWPMSFQLPHIVLWKNFILFGDLDLLRAQVRVRTSCFLRGKCFSLLSLYWGAACSAGETWRWWLLKFFIKTFVRYNWMWDKSVSHRGTNLVNLSQSCCQRMTSWGYKDDEIINWTFLLTWYLAHTWNLNW